VNVCARVSVTVGAVHVIGMNVEKMDGMKAGGVFTKSDASVLISRIVNARSRLARQHWIRTFIKDIKGFVAVTFIVSWLMVATLVYHMLNDWPVYQSFFYAVDTGFSIGFGSFPEGTFREDESVELDKSSAAFTVYHCLMGALIISFALAWFVCYLMSAQDFIKETEKKTEKLAKLKEKAMRKSICADPEQLERIKQEMSNLESDRKKGSKRGSIPPAAPRDKTPVESNDDDRNETVHRRPSFDINIENLLRVKGPLARVRQIYNADPVSSKIFLALLLVIFTGGTGMYWIAPNYSFIQALCFSVGAMATGGFQAPNPAHVDQLIFAGVFSIIGVPVFALACGQLAGLLVNYVIEEREKQKLDGPVMRTPDLKKMGEIKDTITFQDYLIQSLMDIGRLDVSLLDDIKTRFHYLDVDGDGSFTRKEMNCMHLFETYDDDHGGTLDIGEFAMLVERLEEQYPGTMECTPENILEEFRSIDVDGSGTLDKEEFWAWFKELNERKKKKEKKKKKRGKKKEKQRKGGGMPDAAVEMAVTVLGNRRVANMDDIQLQRIKQKQRKRRKRKKEEFRATATNDMVT